MAYEHDIFISYRRHPETLIWIREHFLPLLDHWVWLDSHDSLNVYAHAVTHQIDAGAHWPAALGERLAASRVLIALWTRNYFASRWCAAEFAHMLARERMLVDAGDGRRSPLGLVIPVVIHDGVDFPASLAHIQRLEIQDFYNTRMRRDSELAEGLGEQLKRFAPGLASAISGAPAWRRSWPDDGVQAYFDAFYRPGGGSDPGSAPSFRA